MRFAYVDNRFHYDHYWCLRRIFSIYDVGVGKHVYYTSLLRDVIEPKLWYLAKAQTVPMLWDYATVQAVREEDRRPPMESDWRVFWRSAETIQLIDDEVRRYYRSSRDEDRAYWEAGPPMDSPLYVATERDDDASATVPIVAGGDLERDSS